jgi:L-Ala-D/L-Glu epimerase / N-acetyl-D-glutamate racemase
VRIESIHLSKLQIPLSQPYKLAFRDVGWFDTLLVQATVDGHKGLGEATILNGYTDETVEGSWALATSLSGTLCGRSTEEACRHIEELRRTAPFTATAFYTAIEMAIGHPALNREMRTAVPILHGLNAVDPAGIERELEGALSAGYGTLKIKVGFDLEDDLKRMYLIQRLNRGRAKLRVDANQGYSREDGCGFASRVSPDSIELLEQPCHAKDWDAARAVIAVACVPVMLDESIYDLNDIDRAAQVGATFVKLKLMKCGGLSGLMRGLERIRARGMQPVLGNGVASDIGCWMEASVAAMMIDNAGEMNGYLRQRESLAVTPIVVERGAMQLEPGKGLALSQERLQQLTIDQFAARAPMVKQEAS